MEGKKNIRIRTIEPSDDPIVEEIIRETLIEFGANRLGFAWQDPELSCLSTAYMAIDEQYWVAELEGEVIGGCGIAALKPPVNGVCELQKMYLSPEARGLGVGRLLLVSAIEFAKLHYQWCYLETLQNMGKAEMLYRKQGFIRLPKALVETAHGSCDRWYLKELNK
jgi:putative acetyltransferase